MRSLTLLCLAFSSLFLACGETTPPPKRAEQPRRTTTGATTRNDSPTGAGHSTAMSYDDALSQPEDVMALKGERELRNEELIGILRNPTFMNTCNVPDSMSLTLKIAVRGGKAIGVTVLTRPDDATVAECVDKAVRELTWPESKHRDSFTTTF